jgi:hypothetical protein
MPILSLGPNPGNIGVYNAKQMELEGDRETKSVLEFSLTHPLRPIHWKAVGNNSRTEYNVHTA